ncbi:uncharacterized protein LOC142163297 [Nicotiana tabacum]|uniref:Uncharacterized protein LOC142163297 n=1 Tax=Nicotiana tabacum TaxID=4097 RepID=A0AC58RVA6_TOBAC
MLRKDDAMSWTEESKKAFNKIKEYLSKPPVLVLPEPRRPLVLYMSMLDGAFGCVLGQHDEMGGKNCTQGQALADHLAENPIDGEYKPLKIYFPNEKVSFVGEDISETYDGWRMFFDGAANFKGVGIRATFVLEIGQHYLVYANMMRVPPNTLNATSSPWPFSAWGMDVIKPIESTTSNGHSDLIKAKCETFKIKQWNSIAYKPQMNGVVEAANKNIKKILRKMVDNYKQWQEKLPFALLEYHITVRTSTGQPLIY